MNEQQSKLAQIPPFARGKSWERWWHGTPAEHYEDGQSARMIKTVRGGRHYGLSQVKEPVVEEVRRKENRAANATLALKPGLVGRTA